MAETKTRAGDADVPAFLDSAEPAQRRADGHALADLFAHVTGVPAVMWGPSIVGYGRYRYTYASGHSGEACRVGFSPRKAALVLYVNAGADGHADLFARLGKHTTGKGCLYIKRLSDVDAGVLAALVSAAWADSFAHYPE